MTERSRTRSVLAVSTVVAPGVAAVFGALTGWAMQTTPVAAPVQSPAQVAQGASGHTASLSSGVVSGPLAKVRATAEATHRDVSTLQRQLASLRAQLASAQRQAAGQDSSSSGASGAAAPAPVQQIVAQPVQAAQPAQPVQQIQPVQQQPAVQPAPAAPPPVQTTTGGSTVKH